MEKKDVECLQILNHNFVVAVRSGGIGGPIPPVYTTFEEILHRKQEEEAKKEEE